jgi:hypothetical protein
LGLDVAFGGEGRRRRRRCCEAEGVFVLFLSSVDTLLAIPTIHTSVMCVAFLVFGVC